jgi:hypothetical protein
MKIADLMIDDHELRYAVYHPMTTAIVETVRAEGQCLPRDLLARGFLPEEIERHWKMSKALACIELNLMEA